MCVCVRASTCCCLSAKALTWILLENTGVCAPPGVELLDDTDSVRDNADFREYLRARKLIPS